MTNADVAYLNNCKKRPHRTLFGAGAFFDLNTTGAQSKDAEKLVIGKEYLVGSRGDGDHVIFNTYRLEKKEQKPEKEKPAPLYWVLSGELLESVTVTQARAVINPRFAPFFDKLGRFKQVSVIWPDKNIGSGTFKQADVFPVIYRLITDRTCQGGAFLTHAELVEAMLVDKEGLAEITPVDNKLGPARTASNMVAWFSQRYTMSENQYAPWLERQRIDGTWAYRSTQRTRTSSVTPAAGFPDIEFSAMEGDTKLVTHLQRERNPQLAVEKRKAVLAATKRLACECCGFEARTRFHDIESPIVEVHHRNQLGGQVGTKKTSLADLAILCPTCHRAIHQAKDLSVEDFAAKYFSKE